jgi:hypothetical protein
MRPTLRSIDAGIQEQRNHAPSVFGSLRISVHAQARDRTQELPRRTSTDMQARRRCKREPARGEIIQKWL